MVTLSKRNGIFLLVIALLATIAIYAQVIHFTFVWDDFDLIVNNPFIQKDFSLKTIFLHGLWDSVHDDTPNPPYYRPIVTLAYAIEYRLFGLNPMGFHVVNVLVHLSNGILVWAMARRFKLSIMSASIAAAIFLLHPVQVHTVCFISSHGDTLALFFSLITILIWSKFSRIRYLALFSALIATLSKEVAMLLPLVMVFYDVMLKDAKVKSWSTYLPIISWLPYFTLRHFGLLHSPNLLHINFGAALTGLWHSAGSFRIFLLLGRLLAPLPNPPDIKVPQLPHFSMLLFHFSLLFLISLLILRTKNLRIVRFLLLWLVGSIVLVADYQNMGLRFSDQFLYYPLFIISIVIASVLPQTNRMIIYVGGSLLLLAALTAKAVPEWKNSLTLWKDAIEYEPTNPLYRLNYAEALMSYDKKYEGCETLRYTLKLLEKTFEPSIYTSTSYQFGNCMLDSNPALAQEYYTSALKVNPKCTLCLNNLSIAYLKQNKVRDAIVTAQHLIQIKPEDPEPWKLLGDIYTDIHDGINAEDAFQHVTALQTRK